MNMDQEFRQFPFSYYGIGATPYEMLLPVVHAMEEQLQLGLGRAFTRQTLIGVKKAFCRPASRMWKPGITVDEAKWECRLEKPIKTYAEMENHLMKHFSQSMDIEDQDEFLIGNYTDTSVYLVIKSLNAVWRIRNKRPAGPLGSNVF